MTETKRIQSLTDEYVMNTYGRLPVALSRGQGSRVWDADGKQYLDFVAGIAVNNLGHGHPRLVEAVKQAADTLLHCSNLYHIESQSALAKQLAELSGFQRAFFSNSGAEANEAAIKLARRYAKHHISEDRYEIITAKKSFHGRTLATVTATGQPKYHSGFEPLPSGFRYVPFNDIEALRAALTPNTCAIMLEPIQGEGGVNVGSESYLREVRALCDEHNLLLIFDEVQTGIGRTGKMFGFQHYSVRPDIMSLAKALGNGVPIGATLATEQVAAGFEPGSHASTFGGNPLATSAALAVLQVMTEENLPERAVRMGSYLTEQLKALGQRHPGTIGEVRGKGLLVGAVLTPGADYATRLLQEAMQRGLLVNVLAGGVLRLLPPLIIDEAEVDEAITILEQSIEAIA